MSPEKLPRDLAGVDVLAALRFDAGEVGGAGPAMRAALDFVEHYFIPT